MRLPRRLPSSPCFGVPRCRPRWQRLSPSSSRRSLFEDSFIPTFSHTTDENPEYTPSPDAPDTRSPEERALEHAQEWANRPPIAPKAMPNIRHIVENQAEYRRSCTARKYADLEPLVDLVCERASNIKISKGTLAELRNLASAAGLTIRGLKLSHRDDKRANKTPSEDSLEELAAAQATYHKLRDQIKAVENGADHEKTEVYGGDVNVMSMALSLPNLLSSSTPLGDIPKKIRDINFFAADPNTATARSIALEETGQTLRRTRETRSHADIGQDLGILSMAAGSATSGWGFYYLIGAGARLEQALVQYAIDMAQRAGFRLVSPPSLVYSHMATACGFQPRDQTGVTQTYTIARKEKDANKLEHSLAATAEIPLAAMLANTVIKEVAPRKSRPPQAAQNPLVQQQASNDSLELESSLPLRTVAVSRCYRAEAGARGSNTRGLYRVHEFTKVELFAWTRPSVASATNTLERFVALQANILKNLGLKCRILEMPSGDMGAAAWRKIDIEAWFPQRWIPWGEVTSASICTDYQTRRLATRVRLLGETESGKDGGGDDAGGDSGGDNILASADQGPEKAQAEKAEGEGVEGAADATERPPTHESTDRKDVKKVDKGDKKTTYPWTINGTAMAVPRVLAAILENNWNERDRSVRIPEVLVPYMGGQRKIGTQDWL